jgi:hypothetical protein
MDKMNEGQRWWWGAGSREQRAGSREQGAGSEERGAGSGECGLIDRRHVELPLDCLQILPMRW